MRIFILQEIVISLHNKKLKTTWHDPLKKLPFFSEVMPVDLRNHEFDAKLSIYTMRNKQFCQFSNVYMGDFAWNVHFAMYTWVGKGFTYKRRRVQFFGFLAKKYFTVNMM